MSDGRLKYRLKRIPALQTIRIDIASTLKSESNSVVGGQGRAWIRSGLVLVQIALSFVLLAGAALLIQSARGIQNVRLGFSTTNVLATYVDLRSVGYTAERATIFRDALLDRLQGTAGIESAAWVRSVPFDYRGYSSAPIAVDGYVVQPDEQLTVDYNEVGPGYLATMGIPLLSGREFTRSDNETSGPVAIVNETMAAQYWQGRDPIGSRVQVRGQWRRVVGVASVSRYRRVQEEPKSFFIFQCARVPEA
jgi:hypothetical protein